MGARDRSERPGSCGVGLPAVIGEQLAGQAAAGRLLALQAPVATDLRRVLSALWIVGDVHRMGMLAIHVAQATLRRYPEPVLPVTIRPVFTRMGSAGSTTGSPTTPACPRCRSNSTAPAITQWAAAGSVWHADRVACSSRAPVTMHLDPLCSARASSCAWNASRIIWHLASGHRKSRRVGHHQLTWIGGAESSSRLKSRAVCWSWLMPAKTRAKFSTAPFDTCFTSGRLAARPSCRVGARRPRWAAGARACDECVVKVRSREGRAYGAVRV